MVLWSLFFALNDIVSNNMDSICFFSELLYNARVVV